MGTAWVEDTLITVISLFGAPRQLSGPDKIRLFVRTCDQQKAKA